MRSEGLAVSLARQFWMLMASNDFTRPTQLFSDDFVLDWPQTNERIRGGKNFAKLNAEYPAHGLWHFEVQELVGDETRAVSRVAVSDGVQSALAISFFDVAAGRIVRITEFWPDPYVPPANRQHLTEPMMP